jgi:hypothetical protein
VKNGEHASWSSECEHAFRSLMLQLEQRVRLAHPATGGAFTLFCDTSAEAVGAVLVQTRTRDDGSTYQVPVGFHSQRLKPAESRYSATCLEAFAVLSSVRAFRAHLHGIRLTVVTDHQALTFVIGANHKSMQLCRWRAALAEFDFDIEHRSGKDIAFVDYWSRAPLPGAPPTAEEERPLAHHDALSRSAEFMAEAIATVAARALQHASAARAPTSRRLAPRQSSSQRSTTTTFAAHCAHE